MFKEAKKGVLSKYKNKRSKAHKIPYSSFNEQLQRIYRNPQ
jgi:hypothetical protein